MPAKRRASETSSDKEENAVEATTPSDDTDVPAVKDMDTHDGKGTDPVPDADFDSFATAGVEKEEKSMDVLVQEVLNGRWGDYAVLRERLQAADHDVTAVLIAVNKRIAGGAPATYRATSLQVAEQVSNGEWGHGAERRQRLQAAGYNWIEIASALGMRRDR